MEHNTYKLESVEDLYEFLLKNKPVTDISKTIWGGIAFSVLRSDIHLVKKDKVRELASEYNITVDSNIENLTINNKKMNWNEKHFVQ